MCGPFRWCSFAGLVRGEWTLASSSQDARSLKVNKRSGPRGIGITKAHWSMQFLQKGAGRPPLAEPTGSAHGAVGCRETARLVAKESALELEAWMMHGVGKCAGPRERPAEQDRRTATAAVPHDKYMMHGERATVRSTRNRREVYVRDCGRDDALIYKRVDCWCVAEGKVQSSSSLARSCSLRSYSLFCSVLPLRQPAVHETVVTH